MHERTVACAGHSCHMAFGFAVVYLVGLLQVIPWCRYDGKMTCHMAHLDFHVVKVMACNRSGAVEVFFGHVQAIAEFVLPEPLQWRPGVYILEGDVARPHDQGFILQHVRRFIHGDCCALQFQKLQPFWTATNIFSIRHTHSACKRERRCPPGAWRQPSVMCSAAHQTAAQKRPLRLAASGPLARSPGICARISEGRSAKQRRSHVAHAHCRPKSAANQDGSSQ